MTNIIQTREGDCISLAYPSLKDLTINCKAIMKRLWFIELKYLLIFMIILLSLTNYLI